jgi:rhodanese-related sulfurtransferase
LVFARPVLPTASPADVNDKTLLLDVRELDEWQAGHAEGALHLPMMTVPARLDEVPRDRDVVVVCRVGARSAQVVGYLLAQGWERVRNLDGGMLAWEQAGRSMVSEDGHDPRVI